MRQPALFATVVLLIAVCLADHAALAQAPPAGAGAAAATAPTQHLTLPVAPQTIGAAAAPGGSVQFIGTATVLIRYLGLTIMTDPNFLHKGQLVHLGYGLHSERLTEPALTLALAQLPPIDLVLLSHFHEDHFDRLVQQQLDRNTVIVTTAQAAGKLQALGFQRLVALQPWEALQVAHGDARLTITAMPARHGPAGVAALLPAVMGAMLDFAGPQQGQHYRMYISGDTLLYDDIAHIGQRYPGIDLALLHLGGTRILKVLKVTMDGQDGADILRIIAPARAIPIDYNDYDVFTSPLADFALAVRAAGLENRITYLKHGESYAFRDHPESLR